MASSAAAQPLQALPEVEGDPIGYPTVQAALEDLQPSADVIRSVQIGWTIIEDRRGGAMILWSFAPKDDPAFPSAVKREVVSENGVVSLVTNVQCESTKAACDDLVRRFVALNEKTLPN